LGDIKKIKLQVKTKIDALQTNSKSLVTRKNETYKSIIGIKSKILPYHESLEIVKNTIIDSIDQFADIKSAQFCISCGDSELSMIAAYYGVPMFIFIKNTNSLLLYQLMRFNDVKQGSIAFSPPVHHKPIEEIFQSLLQYIKSIILNETPIETKIPAKRKRNKLVING